ncbi:hypothetical protein [Leucobacter luti]|uniref:hypothetical protein n=1 Tax=Leucobacter luti TaxID=340320 RepID=UPI00106093CB|nr:hypothetical protein [Leucobacter luti]
MSNPLDLFLNGANSNTFSPEAIAKMLRDQPDLLEEFERAYTVMSDGLGVLGPSFAEVQSESRSQHDGGSAPALDTLISGIVDDLLARTQAWSTSDDFCTVRPLGVGASTAKHTELAKSLPESIRPQVTGDSAVMHLPEGGSPMLLMMYAQAMSSSSSPSKRKQFYDRFRQGLDILDLDSLMYDMIALNEASMGRWLPQLAEACDGTELRIPRTTVAQVPLPLLQLTRIDYESINGTTHQILNEWATRAFNLQPDGDYFIKTGIFSSKFDFRNARVREAQEVAELGDYLLFVHQQALSMASPLNPTIMYGAGTTVEWVVREFIGATAGTPTIYHGLPLRTEFRVFIDCDQRKVLSVAPYWESNTMKHRFARMSDADNLNNRHDYVTYMVAEPSLQQEYEQMVEPVAAAVQEMLPRLNLTGQWSLDIMVSGEDLWAIDMAPAHSSAYYETVPPELRRVPAPERWLPAVED